MEGCEDEPPSFPAAWRCSAGSSSCVSSEPWDLWPPLGEVETGAAKGPGAEPDAGTRCAFLVASHHPQTTARRARARFSWAIGMSFDTRTQGCAVPG